MICWSIARGVYLLQEEESNQMLYQQLYLCGLLVWDQFSKFWHTSQPLPEWPSRCFFYSTCIFKHLTQVFHYSKSFDTPANLFLGDPVGIVYNLTSVFLVSNPSVLNSKKFLYASQPLSKWTSRCYFLFSINMCFFSF